MLKTYKKSIFMLIAVFFVSLLIFNVGSKNKASASVLGEEVQCSDTSIHQNVAVIDDISNNGFENENRFSLLYDFEFSLGSSEYLGFLERCSGSYSDRVAIENYYQEPFYYLDSDHSIFYTNGRSLSSLNDLSSQINVPANRYNLYPYLSADSNLVLKANVLSDPRDLNSICTFYRITWAFPGCQGNEDEDLDLHTKYLFLTGTDYNTELVLTRELFGVYDNYVIINEIAIFYVDYSDSSMYFASDCDVTTMKYIDTSVSQSYICDSLPENLTCNDPSLDLDVNQYITLISHNRSIDFLLGVGVMDPGVDVGFEINDITSLISFIKSQFPFSLSPGELDIVDSRITSLLTQNGDYANSRFYITLTIVDGEVERVNDRFLAGDTLDLYYPIYGIDNNNNSVPYYFAGFKLCYTESELLDIKNNGSGEYYNLGTPVDQSCYAYAVYLPKTIDVTFYYNDEEYLKVYDLPSGSTLDSYYEKFSIPYVFGQYFKFGGFKTDFGNLVNFEDLLYNNGGITYICGVSLYSDTNVVICSLMSMSPSEWELIEICVTDIKDVDKDADGIYLFDTIPTFEDLEFEVVGTFKNKVSGELDYRYLESGDEFEIDLNIDYKYNADGSVVDGTYKVQVSNSDHFDNVEFHLGSPSIENVKNNISGLFNNPKDFFNGLFDSLGTLFQEGKDGIWNIIKKIVMLILFMLLVVVIVSLLPLLIAILKIPFMLFKSIFKRNKKDGQK